MVVATSPLKRFNRLVKTLALVILEIISSSDVINFIVKLKMESTTKLLVKLSRVTTITSSTSDFANTFTGTYVVLINLIDYLIQVQNHM